MRFHIIWKGVRGGGASHGLHIIPKQQVIAKLVLHLHLPKYSFCRISFISRGKECEKYMAYSIFLVFGG